MLKILCKCFISSNCSASVAPGAVGELAVEDESSATVAAGRDNDNPSVTSFPPSTSLLPSGGGRGVARATSVEALPSALNNHNRN